MRLCRAALAASAVVLVVVAAASCTVPNHAAQHGHAAAARGDWKAAEAAYRQAIANDPGNVELSQRYAKAKANAIQLAFHIASRCQQTADVACVDRELEYVLWLDPTNVDAGKLQVEARGQLAQTELDAARAAVASSRIEAAFEHTGKARSYSSGGDVLDEVTRIEIEAATLAVAQAGELLDASKAKQGMVAIQLLDRAALLVGLAVQVDAQHGSLAREISSERDRLAALEITARLDAAAAAARADNYREAATLYAEVAQLSGKSEHTALAEHAEAIVKGDAAVERRRFDEAAQWYEIAASKGADGGAATRRLEAARPMVYRIRLESLLITATKPGTNEPWVGSLTKYLRNLVGGTIVVAGTAYATQGNAAAVKAAAEAAKEAGKVPTENRPTLQALFDLPDGRRYRTAKKKGLYVNFGAELYIRTNHYDRRTLRVVVDHHRAGKNQHVGTVNIPLGQIVSETFGEELQEQAPAIAQAMFHVEPADDDMEGAFDQVTVEDGHENQANVRSFPGKGRQRLRLSGAAASVVKADGGDEPWFRVTQGGKVVLQTVTAGKRTTSWTFDQTYLFVDPSETLTIELMDHTWKGSTTTQSWAVSGSQISQGARLTTPAGTVLTLDLTEARDVPQ